MHVTLLTDFGTADYFVAAMKGVILSAAPGVTLTDITHEIPPQDVEAAAFTLLAVYRDFPAGTVHVGVVDPGVGSARRPIAASAGGHFFVGPDNGLFGRLLAREPERRVHHVTRSELFRAPLSATFHGRDIFAPVAAALAAGADVATLGPVVEDFVRLGPSDPVRTDDATLRGAILHVDRFGNCVTSFRREHLPGSFFREGGALRIGEREVRSLRRFYADGTDTGTSAFAIWGSAGFLEISVNRASAARLLDVRRGDPVLALLPTP